MNDFSLLYRHLRLLIALRIEDQIARDAVRTIVELCLDALDRLQSHVVTIEAQLDNRTEQPQEPRPF